MILEKVIVGSYDTNCYIFGSDKTKEVVIIDPGAELKIILDAVNKLGVRPIAILLTHGHHDHSMKAPTLIKHYHIPLMFSKTEYDSKLYIDKPADRWLNEKDRVKVGEITLHVLETPGHSPGSLSFYTKDVKEFNGQKIDGLIFTGDLLFAKSVGKWVFRGGNKEHLYASIKNKIMYNDDLSDNYLVFPGHRGSSSIGEERALNPHNEYFL